mmetsp:Transcript_14570/g.24696  ORF Transcript_14570/g.24696 Transcript_14570/m.24696 type:complete len:362 (+) Transcript_14570:325-1410(+)
MFENGGKRGFTVSNAQRLKACAPFVVLFSSERRQDYCDNVLPNTQLKQFVKFERGLVSIKDIKNIWSYFNDIDVDKKGRVGMGDVRKHRKGLLYGTVTLGPDGHLPDLQDEQREQLIISLLGQVNTPDGISFKGMLSAVYPEASSSDLDKCLKVVHSIKELQRSSDERRRGLMSDAEREEARLRRDISFEAVKEADFIFDMFDINNDGQMCEKEFRNGMWTLTGQDDWDDISHIFEQVMTKETIKARILRKEDFRIAWLNMYKKGKQVCREDMEQVSQIIEREVMAKLNIEIGHSKSADNSAHGREPGKKTQLEAAMSTPNWPPGGGGKGQLPPVVRNNSDYRRASILDDPDGLSFQEDFV